MFFVANSIHIFFLIWLIFTWLFYLTKYQSLISGNFLNWNSWLDIWIWIWSFIVIFLFIIYVISVNFVNKIWTLIWFILSWINIFFFMPEENIMSFVLDWLFSTAYILLFIFLIEIWIKSFKILYNVLVDYKNDFLIVYPEWIYISEKHWALRHESQRIMFDEIVDVSSREKWFFWTLFWFWKLKISIMWTWEDYEFRYCKDITRVPTKLHEKRIAYNKNKKMRSKKSEKLVVNKNKPFKSRIRDDLLKILSLL